MKNPFYSLKLRLNNKREQRKNRRELLEKNFTIISNNCWGEMVYQKYGLQYQTPTVGLFILGHDFVKLCLDWEKYFSMELKFIPWDHSSYYSHLKGKEPYPIALLGDIEVYFMHYHSEIEAAQKWNRRIKRINPDKIIFKLSQREECSKDDIITFMNIPCNKVCFSYEQVDGAIVVPELKDFSGDETPILHQYFDELDYLNKL